MIMFIYFQNIKSQNISTRARLHRMCMNINSTNLEQFGICTIIFTSFFFLVCVFRFSNAKKKQTKQN